MLRDRGLAQLEEPGLLCHQLGYFVRDHEHFRSLLATCDPETRRDMYDSLSPYLRFPAKPLEDYMMATKAKAEAEQLPQWNETTQTYQAYRPPEVRSLEQILTAAVANYALTVTCRRCTRTKTFFGIRKADAVAALREAGWTWNELNGDACEICPECD